jgi:hypothetical protein
MICTGIQVRAAGKHGQERQEGLKLSCSGTDGRGLFGQSYTATAAYYATSYTYEYA